MIPTRRFGRTGLPMPVLSLGGMRFQQSWSDLAPRELREDSQALVEAVLCTARDAGLHHIETARHYGTSERQLGVAMARCADHRRLLQTKVPPDDDPARFEAELRLSFERLQVERVDLVAVHGINLPEHLHQTLRPGGCREVLARWQRQGRIGHVGFSTHAPLPLILEAITSDAFDYVNLHWYYIRRDNTPALQAARRHDMGVFLISPTDKGGHLHSPSPRLLELCAPLHPIVFNDLFCLSTPEVHTLSVGAARPSDLDLHLEAVGCLDQAGTLLPPVDACLQGALLERHGRAWLTSWSEGLPAWPDTPGEINLPVLLWLHTLLEGWDLQSFCRARYGLLGQGGHWFPGRNAAAFVDPADGDLPPVTAGQLLQALTASPWRDRIPALLQDLHHRLAGPSVQRLGGD
jgi:predicted aldo/keto reductase-like oxidoreductase